MPRLGVGVVGAGGSAAAIHLPGYAANDDVEIVGIASLDRDASERLANQYGIPHICDSADELLANASVEAISVCTPPATHEPIATKAVQAGKHVLIEKPVSTTIESLDRIRAMAASASVVVDLVHNERFMDFNIRAKERIRSGAVGQIQAVIQFIGTTGPEDWSPGAKWFRDPKHSGGGVLMDLSVHKIDLAGWLVDRPIRPGASAQFDGEVEDLASVHLIADGPIFLTVTASWRGPADEATLLVVGTEAVLEGSWTVGKLQIRRGHEIEVIDTDVPWTEQDTSPKGMIGSFVDACLSNKKPVEEDLMWDTGTRRVLEAYAARSSR
jgi:predicted dehydrogenase